MRHTPGSIVVEVLVVASLLIQGCATQSGSSMSDELAQTERIDEPTVKAIPHDVGATTSRSWTRPAMRAELSARNATGLPNGSLLDVLFDFDQATLRMDALPILEANARRLREDGVTRLLLEGRGDEIGTAAYNIVLGERRAKTVKLYLQELGLTGQFKTTSYGKDRPLCFQHSGECLQKNRSVHFVVKE